MTAFGSLRRVSVVGGEDAEILGLSVSMKRQQHVDANAKQIWTIISVSAQNGGYHCVEFLFAALLSRQSETKFPLRRLGRALCTLCSRRQKQSAGRQY